LSGPALYSATGNATTLARLRRVADPLGCDHNAVSMATGEMGTVAQTPPQEALTWGYCEPNFVSLTLAPAGVPVRARGERA